MTTAAAAVVVGPVAVSADPCVVSAVVVTAEDFSEAFLNALPTIFSSSNDNPQVTL